MKIIPSALILLFVLWFPACAKQIVFEVSSDEIRSSNEPAYRYKVGALKSLIIVTPHGAEPIRRCAIEAQADQALLSHDGSALIISSTGYIPIARLQKCSSTPLRILNIPTNVGFLADINLDKGIYLSLDVVGAAPLSFLATVAKLGSKTNLSDLPGSYEPHDSIDILQASSFTYSEEDKPKISPNGRYVSPSGRVDCGENAYPGVWDLTEAIRVVFTAKDGSDKEQHQECLNLFE